MAWGLAFSDSETALHLHSFCTLEPETAKKATVVDEGIEWTAERIAQAKALRWYQQQWNKCPLPEQRSLEWHVYDMRGRGLPESEVSRIVSQALDLRRPWRMSDRQLGAALGALYARRRSHSG